MTRAATIRDVAKAAGLSISSVSNILAESGRYSYRPETVERVRQAAAELDYRPHSMASALRRQESTLIGIAVSTDVPFGVNRFTVAVRRELIARGLHPVLMEILARDMNQVPGRDLLAGFISIEMPAAGDRMPVSDSLRNQMPGIALYPSDNGHLDCVTTDRACAVEMAVEHLVSLGHRRIAFAERMAGENCFVRSKVEGWHRACRKLGLDGRDAIDIPLEVERDGAYLVSKLCEMSDPPSALVCTSDNTALYVIGRLAARGWRMPENLSVIGFDGVPYGDFSFPPLTTVAQPFEDIARAAVDRLVARIEAEREGRTLPVETSLIKPNLLLRASTGRAEDWRPLSA